jgi:hypothetical protein
VPPPTSMVTVATRPALSRACMAGLTWTMSGGPLTPCASRQRHGAAPRRMAGLVVATAVVTAREAGVGLARVPRRPGPLVTSAVAGALLPPRPLLVLARVALDRAAVAGLAWAAGPTAGLACFLRVSLTAPSRSLLSLLGVRDSQVGSP